MDKIDDALFEKAFSYKQTKIWKKIEEYIFAVKHDDGVISYCRFDTRDGYKGSLMIYPGEAGFATMMEVLKIQENPYLYGGYYYGQL